MWRNRQRNTTKYAVGTVAKEVVSKAKSLKAGVAMEKLTFKSVSKGYLVPRYKLMIAVKTLCEREGVPFKLVPAQYTSITCPKCGYRDEKNRSDEWFKCLKCGYQTDADLAGAMNIALRALDGTADGAVNDVRHASRLKPRKASPSEAGCVAQPKAPMRDVPLERGVSYAEQSREKEEVKAKPQGGVEKKLEEWLKTEGGLKTCGCNNIKKCNRLNHVYPAAGPGMLQ
jgi:predicted RNA-binding Zn-ribbon protein involved in translation (DUF1610 family)